MTHDGAMWRTAVVSEPPNLHDKKTERTSARLSFAIDAPPPYLPQRSDVARTQPTKRPIVQIVSECRAQFCSHKPDHRRSFCSITLFIIFKCAVILPTVQQQGVDW